ncbi:uncharacterized protein LOC143907554, partial [Temnothorax americanus]|uniref:uncharacterized protein LOC143907554 n=1 Tax=Temnothorax americanus TaxID=1964332 RepID=UPI0040678191
MCVEVATYVASASVLQVIVSHTNKDSSSSVVKEQTYIRTLSLLFLHIKQLATRMFQKINCKFPDAHKDDQILDQLICGLKSKAIKAELLKIDDLKLDSAIKKALASEAANKETDKLLHNETSREELHKVNVFQGRGKPNQQRQREEVTGEVSTVSRRDRPNQGQIPAQRRQQGDTRSSVNRCYSCGMFGHWRNECRLRDSLICNLCKRRGHVDLMCQERRRTRNYTTNNDRKLNFVNACEEHNDLDNKSDTAASDEDDLATNDKTYGLYNLKYVSGKKMVKPQFMPVKINGININMEIDSGAAMSVIPMKLKEKYFHNIIMYKPDIEFVNHDESISKPVGMFKNVQIEANNCKLRTDVYVIKSSSPPIIGRSWLEAINLWPLYKELELHSIKTTSNNKRLQAILSSHKRFFESNKSIFTKGNIKLELKEGVTPKYVKARSVPFALEKKIERELNRLVDERVLEPVETSPGYFQKKIEKIFTDLKNVAIVADDVIVTGDDNEDHLRNLDRVLTRLEQCGLKGRVEKWLDAWISQPYSDGEKPVAFASTKLTKAQEKYSQIDREAAAVIFGITKFYDYLYAREFILRIDNKPLSQIFSPEKGIPKMAASRLQNWSYFLSAFNYKVECIGTKDNIVADTLSRLPTNYVEQNKILDSVPSYSYLHYAIQSKITCLDYKAVARKTSKDKVLSLVKRMVTNGWPERKINAWTEELKPYALRRDELSTEKECLMWGQRVIIP